ncbi:MAG: hypothetical protein V4521_08115, partial [Pseudomonadota bacterium]
VASQVLAHAAFHLAVEVRGLDNSGTWQSVALDGAGRLKLLPTQPGLIEIRVTATDLDGFTATRVQTVRVKDPADSAAPQLNWTGLLAGGAVASGPFGVTGGYVSPSARAKNAGAVEEAQDMAMNLLPPLTPKPTWRGTSWSG